MITDPMMKYADDIAKMLPYWDLVDALIGGRETVLLNPTLLPQFPKEDADTYNFRKQTTKYTNVYGDIVDDLVSKPFEEEITLSKTDGVVVPLPIEEFIEDVDGSGNNLTVFSNDTFYNAINSVIDWILIDFPKRSGPAILSVAQAKQDGIRPFWSHVIARNVLEVKTDLHGGKRVLTYVRILEPGKPNKIRIFERVASVVTWELWVETEKTDPVTNSRFRLEDSGTLDGIDEIPMVPMITGRRNGTTWQFRPPLRASAELQVELYQQESALKFIKIMAGYPMLAANGLKPAVDSAGKPLPVAIGPMRVLWAAPDGNGNSGTWSFIEPSSTSMQFLAADIDTTTKNLRELGKQPLTAQSGNLTVITTAVAAGKARSAVSAWSLLLKDTLENALRITAQWMNVQYEPQVYVFNEFDNFTDDGKDLDTLNTARKNCDLSLDTYWNELKRRRVLSPEFNAELERQKLLEDVPSDDGEEDDDPAPLPGDAV